MGDVYRRKLKSRDVLGCLAVAVLAVSFLAIGCGTAPSSPEEQRIKAESECRTIAEHGLRARPPSEGVQSDIYRQCMQKKGYPNP
jgi:hypothetical protein